MRKLIGQILEVVTKVQNAGPSNHTEVMIARKAAVIETAFDHGVDKNTTSNKFRRELGLDGTKDFDELLADWVLGGSQNLRDVLLERAGSEDESVAIRQVFRWRIRRITIEPKDDKWWVQIAPDAPSGALYETDFDAYSDALDWIVKNTK